MIEYVIYEKLGSHVYKANVCDRTGEIGSVTTVYANTALCGVGYPDVDHKDTSSCIACHRLYLMMELAQ